MTHRIKSAIPILPCANLEAMMSFYVDRLGFERRWAWQDPEDPDRAPTDGGVGLGDIQIFFMTDAALAERSADREIMLFTQDLDAQYRDHVARGAPVSAPPADEPWGLREYSVTDPHGNRLRFAEGIELIRSRVGE